MPTKPLTSGRIKMNSFCSLKGQESWGIFQRDDVWTVKSEYYSSLSCNFLLILVILPYDKIYAKKMPVSPSKPS